MVLTPFSEASEATLTRAVRTCGSALRTLSPDAAARWPSAIRAEDELAAAAVAALRDLAMVGPAKEEDEKARQSHERANRRNRARGKARRVCGGDPPSRTWRRYHQKSRARAAHPIVSLTSWSRPSLSPRAGWRVCPIRRCVSRSAERAHHVVHLRAGGFPPTKLSLDEVAFSLQTN